VRSRKGWIPRETAVYRTLYENLLNPTRDDGLSRSRGRLRISAQPRVKFQGCVAPLGESVLVVERTRKIAKLRAWIDQPREFTLPMYGDVSRLLSRWLVQVSAPRTPYLVGIDSEALAGWLEAVQGLAASNEWPLGMILWEALKGAYEDLEQLFGPEQKNYVKDLVEQRLRTLNLEPEDWTVLSQGTTEDIPKEASPVLEPWTVDQVRSLLPETTEILLKKPVPRLDSSPLSRFGEEKCTTR
jgi:hypothetical protein